MTTERNRCVIFSALLVVAVVGASAFMASVVIGTMYWRIVLQIAGLAACLVAAGTLVVLIRHWGGPDDDFWWPDPDPDR